MNLICTNCDVGQLRMACIHKPLFNTDRPLQSKKTANEMRIIARIGARYVVLHKIKKIDKQR